MPMTTLRSARTTGLITQAEYEQYRDFYLGLEMLNRQSDHTPAVGQCATATGQTGRCYTWRKDNGCRIEVTLK